MSIKTKDELLTSIKTLIGDNSSDEAITLLEDVTDTITDFETKTASTTNWEQKYNDLDKEWRQRYTERFFNHSGEDNEDNTPPDFGEDEPEEKTKFEELFSQKGD